MMACKEKPKESKPDVLWIGAGKIDWAKERAEYEAKAKREKPFSTILSKHQFDNNGYYEQPIVCRIAYGSTDNACDTIFIGKQIYYVLICGSWQGCVNKSECEGYALSMEVNPKYGRQTNSKSRYYWLVYLDEMCGFRLKRLTRFDRITNAYTSFLK